MQAATSTATSPQTYGLKLTTKLLYLLCAVFYAFITVVPLALTKHGSSAGISILFLLPALYLLSLALRTRLTLDGDHLRFRSALRTFNITRNQIEGFRTIRGRYGRFTKICLKDNHGSFSVTRSIAGNNELMEWFGGLPNLDERDADAIKSKISQQQESTYGIANPALPLRRAKYWMIALCALAVAMCICAWIRPASFLFASAIVLWLLPAVAVVLLYRFPLLYTIFKPKTDPRADLTWLLAIPAFGLLAAVDIGNSPNLVDASRLGIWFALAFFCFSAALAQPAWNSTRRWGAFIALLTFAGMYSFGAIHTLDTVPDHSSARPYQSQIVRMYETDGRHTHYHLRIAPWGPMRNTRDVDVSEDIYNQVSVGEYVCIGLHPGYLHAPWYTLTPCTQ